MTLKHVTLPPPPAGAAGPLLHLRGGVQGDGLHRAYRAVPEQDSAANRLIGEVVQSR